jgi:hypothetical protein
MKPPGFIFEDPLQQFSVVTDRRSEAAPERGPIIAYRFAVPSHDPIPAIRVWSKKWRRKCQPAVIGFRH